ncbi:MAG: DUF5009 domain-containing protein [Phycisphaerae bacterium]|nr:DUF5009 domain-containing protein [Phycisphaerae bacterium]
MSIDALRGFDMFWITGGKGVLLALAGLVAKPVPEWLNHQLEHVPWQGFTAWDLIMPLFLFVVGTSMPFSFAKRIERGQVGPGLYWKIVRRTLILFVLGMVAQGNLLAFDLSKLHIYSNTLQAIACGYFVAAIVMLNVSITGQVLVTAGLLAGYWALMALVPFGGHAAGVIEPQTNLALAVDKAILGRFEDGTTYTWILSGMGFAASTLLGVLSGHVLRSPRAPTSKVAVLVGAGVGCLLLGKAWGHWFPIIKHIWSSSMVLYAGGWSFLLLAAFYGIIDVIGLRRWAFPFVVIGMNAIFIYMAVRFIPFGQIGDRLAGGLASRLGSFGEPVRVLTALLIMWLMLYYMYRKRTFVRV